jgi:hypothetical protein
MGESHIAPTLIVTIKKIRLCVEGGGFAHTEATEVTH